MEKRMKKISIQIYIVIGLVIFSIFISSIIQDVNLITNTYRMTISNMLRDNGSVSSTYINQMDYINNLVVQRTRLTIYITALEITRSIALSIVYSIITYNVGLYSLIKLKKSQEKNLEQ